jgi:hypothetical protein
MIGWLMNVLKLVKWSTRRKLASVPPCPPQIPLDLTLEWSRASAVGSRRLTAWAMARPKYGIRQRDLNAVLIISSLQFIRFGNNQISPKFVRQFMGWMEKLGFIVDQCAWNNFELSNNLWLKPFYVLILEHRQTGRWIDITSVKQRF